MPHSHVCCRRCLHWPPTSKDGFTEDSALSATRIPERKSPRTTPTAIATARKSQRARRIDARSTPTATATVWASPTTATIRRKRALPCHSESISSLNFVRNYFYIESALSGCSYFLREKKHSGLCDWERRIQMRPKNVLSMWIHLLIL